MTPLYRFSFETDEQYNARVQGVQANENTNTQVPVQQGVAAEHPRSTFQSFLPGWIIGVLAAAILMVWFRSHRQKLIRRARGERGGGPGTL